VLEVATLLGATSDPIGEAVEEGELKCTNEREENVVKQHN